MEVLENFDVQSFQQDLIQWYEENKRDLPWRQDRDPYKIWVSEVMLQQTRVDTVIPYFHNFMEKFPTIHDLAAADLQTVLKAWEGLGYYSRARNLHEAAQKVVDKYDGQVPDDPKELGSLKGIGPYTLGAIMSIAFSQPLPAVDGNVMRVLSRILMITDDITETRTKKQFQTYGEQMISKENPSSFNQGLMELGALICTPKEPLCLFCPLQEHCRAYEKGIQTELPNRGKAKRQRTIPYVVLLVKTDDDRYIIEKRPSTGLLADLWQFPMVPIGEIGLEHVENWFYNEYGVKITLKEKKGNLKHVFTHIIWELFVYEAEIVEHYEDQPIHLVAKDELVTYPFPASHLKMMKYIE